MSSSYSSEVEVMRHALDLAERGLGFVEPNPMVGAVIVDDQLRPLGEGWHERFGGPHAEVRALEKAGELARGATAFVTLEPCCHFGKTPPCTRALITAGIRRVVVAQQDPARHVNGGGIAELREAGVEVDVGLCRAEAEHLTAPFVKLMTRQLPWVHAKWAMTLDGKIASRTGHSQWISSHESRARVHHLRGRVDGIIVGARTAQADDPLLTARPPGPRIATRIVIDSQAQLPLTSKLVMTARQIPVLCMTADDASPEAVEALRAGGVEVVGFPRDESGHVDPSRWLEELGRRGMTHVLVEGGGTLLGSLHDRELIDEFHVYVAPKLVGGAQAITGLEGVGREQIPEFPLENLVTEIIGGDVYFHGRARRSGDVASRE